MTRYFKRRWEQSRGDHYASWGCAVYYFEVDDTFYALRQIEIYDNGNVLKYNQANVSDQYGMLLDADLEADDFQPFEITQAEFEEAWNGTRQFNRVTDEI